MPNSIDRWCLASVPPQDGDHHRTVAPRAASATPPPEPTTPPPEAATPPHGAEPSAEGFHDGPVAGHGGRLPEGAAADGPPSELLGSSISRDSWAAPQHYVQRMPQAGEPQLCGLDGVIFEPAAHVPVSNFCHVGTGHGAYERVQDFQYVGERGGDFAKQEITVPYGWRMRKWFVGLMGILCCLALLVLLFALVRSALSRAQPEATPEAPPVPTPPVAPAPDLPPSLDQRAAPGGHYDCDVGWADGDWESSWSVGKRAFCCGALQRACPGDSRMSGSSVASDEELPGSKTATTTAVPASTTTATTITSLRFDCKAGFARRERGWSDLKKSYCCETFDVCGTTGTSTPAAPTSASMPAAPPDMSVPAPPPDADAASPAGPPPPLPAPPKVAPPPPQASAPKVAWPPGTRLAPRRLLGPPCPSPSTATSGAAATPWRAGRAGRGRGAARTPAAAAGQRRRGGTGGPQRGSRAWRVLPCGGPWGWK
ncbi:unnamed protein product, partial [Prorocentrum cordatum]